MDLYACGFNAHGQLSLDPNFPNNDISMFKKIASGISIRVLHASWSQTVLLIDNHIHLVGHNAPSPCSPTSAIQSPAPHTLHSFISTHDGLYGALSETGHFHILDPAVPLTFSRLGTSVSPTLSHLAVASNETVVAVAKASPAANLTHLLSFPCLSAFQTWYLDPTGDPAPTHFMLPGQATRLLAGATFFALLMETGEVFTWGDARHRDCLGRIPSDASPAEKPGLVEALGGVPIAKIAVGGWMAFALSKERDLYAWGKAAPSFGRRLVALEGDREGYDDEEVKLMSVGLSGRADQVVDVLDVAAGNGHAVVLVENGKVYGLGEAESGQLGLGEGELEFAANWREIKGLLGKTVKNVMCGDRCSFVLVKG